MGIEEVFSFAARYGGTSAFAVVLFYVLWRWLQKQDISINISTTKNGKSKSNGGNNGRPDRATLEAIMMHQRECAPVIHQKIEANHNTVVGKLDNITEKVWEIGERVAHMEGAQG